MTGSCPAPQRRSHRRLVALFPFIFGCLAFFGAPYARGTTYTVVIHAIQDFDSSSSTNSAGVPQSPYLGKYVKTSGIVIAVLTDGFYIEEPKDDWDSDTCTAEGIFVYTPSGVPSNAVQGYNVTVTGLVEASNSSDYAGTQILATTPYSTYITTNSTGNSLPEAVTSSTLTAAIDGTCSAFSDDTFGEWLPFEGMRVNVPSSSTLMVTQGTGGTVSVSSTAHSASTDGQFWAVFSTTRPFRETGISELESVPSTAPSTVQRWDGNPELLLVDTTTLGGTAINAAAGTEYSGGDNLVGIIDYHVSTLGYTGLLLTSDTASSLSSSNTITATAAATRSTGQYTLATQDLDNLQAVETERITKLAEAIVTYEHSPDVVAVQNVTSAALTKLIAAIASAGGPTYKTGSVVSTADSSGYLNAFLVNSSKFTSYSVSRALATTTYTTTSSTTATLFPHCPLVLAATIARTGTTAYQIYAVNVGLTSRTNIDSSTLGANVRRQRELQAQTIATSILEPYESAGDHVLVLGGMNSSEFSDGYVDSLGILDGYESTNTSAGTLVTLYDSTYNTTQLVNTTTSATNVSLNETNPSTSRYTYVESGSAEQPDHILVTSELADLVSIDYARIGADFPVSQTYDTSVVNRASSHDGVVAYLTIPYPSSLKLTSSKNPSYYGNAVTFTATVSASSGTTPTGTVNFYNGSTEICDAVELSSGKATCTISTLTVGSHTIKASYGGSAAFDTSSSTLIQVVYGNAVTLKLTSSLNPSYYTESVTFTLKATTTGSTTPTGTITFYDGTTTLGTGTLSSGSTTYTTAKLTAGTHTIKASFPGDTVNASASTTLSQVVTAPATTTSTVVCAANPAYYGATVTCTDTVAASSGTPTGTVTFYDGTTSLGTATLSSGKAAYSSAKFTVGSHTIKAVYAGATKFATSTGTTTEVIKANVVTLALTSSLNPSYYTESVTFTLKATTTGPTTPAGTITFYDGTTSLGTGTLSSGATTLTTTKLAVGTHTIKATYPGQGTNSAATSNTVSQVVKSPDTTTSTVVCAANPAYYSATVTCTDTVAATTGTPTGSVTFYDGSTKLSTAALASGKATYSSSTFTIGSHTIRVVYGGTVKFATSTGTTTEVIKTNVVTLKLTSGTNPSYLGQSVTFTAKATSTATSTPTGTVTFYDGTTSLGTGALSSGAATLTTAKLAVGTHTIKATFPATTTSSAATSNTGSQVVKTTYATTSTLTCTPNPAQYAATVTCTDKVASTGGTPTGTVTFYDGTTSLGTGTLSSGKATLSTSSLTAGSHSIKAVYATTYPFLTSTSNTVKEVILATFSIATSSKSWTGYTGEAGTFTVTIAPGTGFTFDVALACSGLPSNTTCKFTPSTVADGSGKAKMVVQTTAPSASGGVVSGGTTPGTYTLTITGTADDGGYTITKTATVSITVKSMF